MSRRKVLQSPFTTVVISVLPVPVCFLMRPPVSSRSPAGSCGFSSPCGLRPSCCLSYFPSSRDHLLSRFLPPPQPPQEPRHARSRLVHGVLFEIRAAGVQALVDRPVKLVQRVAVHGDLDDPLVVEAAREYRRAQALLGLHRVDPAAERVCLDRTAHGVPP